MDEEIKKIVDVLRKGGVILYPTDTIWGLGCDATNSAAADKIFKAKGRVQEKALIILVSSIDMLRGYVEEVPEISIDLVKGFSGPLTVIYPNAKNLPKNVMASDKSIAARIPDDEFCQKLLKAFGKPITSTSANISGDPSPLTFSKVSEEVVKSVDYVVETNRKRINKPRPSTIVSVDRFGDLKILRS